MVELQIDPHAREVILTSQTGISEMVNDDEDDA